MSDGIAAESDEAAGRERRTCVYRNRSLLLPLGARIKSALMIGACDISVTIPTLNEEKYLPRCLESISRQSQKERFEIILIEKAWLPVRDDVLRDHRGYDADLQPNARIPAGSLKLH